MMIIKLDCSGSFMGIFKEFHIFVLFGTLIFATAKESADQKSPYKLKDVEVVSKNGAPIRVFTAAELKHYDGSEAGNPIYMGIKGAVFDVSKGKDFYGKSGPYNVLVGKDSTRAVAKMSLEPDDMTHDITDLPDSTLKFLDDVFTGTYLAKYPIIGYMDYLLEQYPEKFEHQKLLKSEL